MKRNIANELVQALEEAILFEQGKITLNTITIERKHSAIEPEQIKAIRERFNMSRAVFALRLRVSPRTLEKWEQGLAKPNEQAATLLLLTSKYPDTLERLSSV
jgi:putative transcriptional regulator